MNTCRTFTLIMKPLSSSTQTPERGSRTIVYGAISPDLEGNGGTYLSNCQVASTSGIVNDELQREKFFNFTRDLLKVENFGNSANKAV